MKVPARIARYRILKLVEVLKRGERVEITRYGKTVAELYLPATPTGNDAR